jgi:hypothetical protein
MSDVGVKTLCDVLSVIHVSIWLRRVGVKKAEVDGIKVPLVMAIYFSIRVLNK